MSILGLSPQVPIIGQPKMVDWLITFVMKCTCGHPVLVEGQAPALGICHECRTQYMIANFALNETGDMMIQLASRPEPPPDGGTFVDSRKDG